MEVKVFFTTANRNQSSNKSRCIEFVISFCLEEAQTAMGAYFSVYKRGLAKSTRSTFPKQH